MSFHDDSIDEGEQTNLQESLTAVETGPASPSPASPSSEPDPIDFDLSDPSTEKPASAPTTEKPASAPTTEKPASAPTTEKPPNATGPLEVVEQHETITKTTIFNLGFGFGSASHSRQSSTTIIKKCNNGKNCGSETTSSDDDDDSISPERKNLYHIRVPEVPHHGTKSIDSYHDHADDYTSVAVQI